MVISFSLATADVYSEAVYSMCIDKIFNANSGESCYKFLLDSGSTNHILSVPSLVSRYTGQQVQLRGLNSTDSAPMCHSSCLQFLHADAPLELFLMGAIFFKSNSDTPLNILSENRLVKQDSFTISPKRDFLIWTSPDSSTSISIKIESCGLLDFISLSLADGAAMVQELVGMTLDRHEELGHIPLLKAGQCGSCDRTKRQKRGIRTRPKDDGAFSQERLISTDLSGPHVVSYYGSKYMMLVKVHHSKEVISFYCPDKSSDSTAQNLRGFIKIRSADSFTHCRTDNGTEFAGAFGRLLSDLGKAHYNSPAWTPKLNSDVEVENRIVCMGTAAILLASGVDLRWWPSASSYFCYTLGRLPRKCLNGESSFQRRNDGRLPNNKHLVKFNTRGFYGVSKKPDSKFLPKRKECFMRSYSYSRRGYIVWDPILDELLHSLDVIWEDRDGVLESFSRLDGSEFEDSDGDEIEEDISIVKEQDSDPVDSNDEIANCKDHGGASAECIVNEVSISTPSPTETPAVSNAETANISSSPNNSTPEIEFVLGVNVEIDSDERILSDDEVKALNLEVDQDFVNHLRATCNQVVDLKTAERLWPEKEFLAARSDECRKIDRSIRWELPPSGARCLPTRMIFTIKSDGVGGTRYKARLVAVGFLEPGIELSDSVYAPTLSPESFRFSVALGAGLSWDSDNGDITAAFLEAEVPPGTKPIYLDCPKGYVFKSAHEKSLYERGYRLRVVRAVYGLRKAPLWWAQHFRRTVSKHGFISGPTERCLFIIIIEGNLCLCLCFVDDIFITGRASRRVKELLMQWFPLRDLSPGDARPKEFLGVQLEHVGDKVLLHHTNYIKKIISEWNLSEKGVPVPLLQKCLFEGENLDVPTSEYRRFLGQSNYTVTMLRPDCAYAQSHLQRFSTCQKKHHLTAVRHYQKYIAGTKSAGLFYTKFDDPSRIQISASADSDWKGCLETKRSTGGHNIFLNGALIHWKSRLIPGNTKMSSTETEFIQLGACCKDVIFFRRLFSQFITVHFPLLRMMALPSPIKEDNTGAIDTARGGGKASKLRHMDHHEFYARECEETGEVAAVKVHTDDNDSDLHTKPAGSRPRIERLLCRYNFVFCIYDYK